MSTKDYKNSRLSREEARKLIVQLASIGSIILSRHARSRLLEREIIFNDVLNVLLSKSMQISDAEVTRGGYTYRCYTKRFVVVVGFTMKGESLIVVTVFQIEKRV